jgi:hypothetical protein
MIIDCSAYGMHRAAVMLCRDTPCKATFSHCALGSARKKISLRGWELQEPAIGIGVVGGARDAGWHMSRRFFIDNQGFFQGLEHFGSYTEATSGPVAVASCCLSLLNTLVARAPYWQSTPSKVLLGHACHASSPWCNVSTPRTPGEANGMAF